MHQIDITTVNLYSAAAFTVQTALFEGEMKALSLLCSDQGSSAPATPNILQAVFCQRIHRALKSAEIEMTSIITGTMSLFPYNIRAQNLQRIILRCIYETCSSLGNQRLSPPTILHIAPPPQWTSSFYPGSAKVKTAKTKIQSTKFMCYLGICDGEKVCIY